MNISKSNKNPLRKEYEEYVQETEEWLTATYFENKNNENPKKEGTDKKAWSSLKLAFLVVSLLGLALLAYGGFIFLRIHEVAKKINIEPTKKASLMQDLKSTAMALVPSQRKTLSGEDEGRINLLLLGAAGEKKPGRNLTDTIMIASIDTNAKKVALLSLPRDMYARIPDTNSFTKINSLYQYGLNHDKGAKSIKKSVEEITGLTMHYYLIVDFDGFTKFIDTLGGINVDVERDIYDTRYPGPNYSYETFELKKGFQRLDGETALKYVRERHADPEGDFGRAKRQQQVMQSVKTKAFSIKTILNPAKINEILGNLEDNIKTNLALDDIESFLALSNELDTQNISTKVVDAWEKDSLLKVSHVFYGSIRTFILVPKAGNYSQIHDLANNIFDLGKTERKMAEIRKEEARILIINRSGEKTLPQKVKELLSDNLGMKSLEISSLNESRRSQKTEVLDFTEKNKVFALNEIITSVPATLSESTEKENFKKYDFVLILGQDIIDAYKFEEQDIESFRNSEDSLEYFEIIEE